MANRMIGLPDLRRILHESAGTQQGVDLEGEILDTTFEDLGYDSLAVMETAARLTQEFGVPIDEDELSTATTPRQLLDIVNPS